MGFYECLSALRPACRIMTAIKSCSLCSSCCRGALQISKVSTPSAYYPAAFTTGPTWGRWPHPLCTRASPGSSSRSQSQCQKNRCVSHCPSEDNAVSQFNTRLELISFSTHATCELNIFRWFNSPTSYYKVQCKTLHMLKAVRGNVWVGVTAMLWCYY